MRDLYLLDKLSELSPIPATGENFMKNRTITLFTILLTLVLLAPSTSANSAGRSAKTIANTILNGKGAPKISIGIDGDFYIDTRSLQMYGPKKKGRWPIPANLQGPTGPSGATGSAGKSGNDGKTISSASTTSGPQGPIGPAGPQGLIGLPGASGPAGPTGAAGKDGAPGSSGPAGGSGGSGPAGATGAQGPAGATGAQGPAGETSVVYGHFEFNDFSAASASVQSVTLRGFKSRTSYVVRVRIFVYQPLEISEYFLPLALAVNSPLGNPVVHAGYVLSHGYSYRENSGRYENSILAEIVLDGISMDSDYEISLKVTAGRNTSGNGVAKSRGDFTASEVSNTQNYA